jgi:nondiscriminating glutamyl-tRNA synthetase
MTKSVRVRFAPSPTGLLHLGSVRIALFNYLFAQQNNGTFILRIEDTDAERNFDPGAKLILQDLAWLGLVYQEGPEIEGPYGPYFQSERFDIYKEHLDRLIGKNDVYRCFCTEEELEKKRVRQIALKQPPRYDRICLQLTKEDVTTKLDQATPFIWRFKLDSKAHVSVNDMARTTIEFDLSHFSDFPITRKNGSFTFLFANAVDDIVMNISHIIRGEDHISNTPCQIALYQAFQFPSPTFWHMPIICNTEGKKLSKRDFGFSLQDLKEGGFLAEAINNYLAIIGGSFKQEIMTLQELVAAINFTTINPVSTIKYDVEKLTWVNHQWLTKYSTEQLLEEALPFLLKQYPEIMTIDRSIALTLLKAIQPELKTLKDIPNLLAFYFTAPTVSKESLLSIEPNETTQCLLDTFKQHYDKLSTPELFYTTIAHYCKEQGISVKNCWKILRTVLTGSAHGPGIKELITLLGAQETKKRIDLV